MHLSYLPIAALVATSTAQLNKLAVAKGKQYFGSATDNPELTDVPYKAILVDTNEFGQITPGNAQKWAYSEPQQGNFSFTGGDQIAALTQQTGQKLRCHTLVWHSQLPNWVSSGTWTNDTLIAAMKNHIKGMVQHYKGQCLHWDVVNEAFNEDGTYRSSVFSNTIGPEFIPIAFQTAAQYDPDVKLYYNDYNLEYNGAKAASARQLVANLTARGIKIDGVGFQGHMIVGSTPARSSLTTALQSFTSLGVDVAYTELDVRHSTLPPTTAALAQQDVDFGNLVGSCLNVARCVGITIWDFTDKYSWIPSTFPGQGDALLWDVNLVKKEDYYAVATVLGATNSSSTTQAASSTTTTRVSTTTPVMTTTRVSTTPISSPTTTTTTRRVSTTLITTTASTTKRVSSSTGIPAAYVARWGQCGGLTYTGPTVCQPPYTCQKQNDWYSQCL